jgi:hypothetical protein
MSAPSRLQIDAGRLRTGIGWLVGVLAVLLLAERFGPLLVNGAGMPAIVIAAVQTVAPAAYLSGLWAVRPALASIRDGVMFGAAISAALRRVGLMLVAGSAFELVVKPSLLTALGVGPGYVIALDFAGYALVGIGIALVLLARLIAEARGVQNELDGMF